MQTCIDNVNASKMKFKMKFAVFEAKALDQRDYWGKTALSLAKEKQISFEISF